MFTSNFSASNSFNNIVSFFRPSEVRDRMYERWSVNERMELASMLSYMEHRDNPWKEEDLETIPDTYWGWKEFSPFYEEELDAIPNSPSPWDIFLPFRMEDLW
jgi:hypothetical protein